MGTLDFVLQALLAAFSFAEKGAKEKAIKKKTPLGEFRRLRTARRASRPPPRKLLKKGKCASALTKTLMEGNSGFVLQDLSAAFPLQKQGLEHPAGLR